MRLVFSELINIVFILFFTKYYPFDYLFTQSVEGMSGISPIFLQKSLELRDNTSSRKAAAKALKKAVKNYQQSEALPINEMNRLHPPGNFSFFTLWYT